MIFWKLCNLVVILNSVFISALIYFDCNLIKPVRFMVSMTSFSSSYFVIKMDSEKVPIFAGQASSETGKDEQPLYYDKTNHPIMVRNSAVCVCACLCYFSCSLESLTVAVVCRQQLQVWQVPISV